MPKSRIRRASITMCSGIYRASGALGRPGGLLYSRPHMLQLPAVERESRGQSLHLLTDGCDYAIVAHVLQDFGDQRANLAHLRFVEAAGGDGRRAEADAAGVERR